MNPLNRRSFLRRSALAGSFTLLAPHARAMGANGDLRVGVIGVRQRGRRHLAALQALGGVRIAALCDVDRAVLDESLALLGDAARGVSTYEDYRELCADDGLDAVIVATPNHSHCLIALEAIRLGRHVYIESPLSQNLREGRILANAVAAKPDTVVQHGFQLRSSRLWDEVFAWLDDKPLGELGLARARCHRIVPDIGKVRGAQLAPETLNYALWSAPRERMAILRKQFHGDWAWQHLWGNGLLGQEGTHQLDLCRRAIGDPRTLPASVQSAGGRFGRDDDSQWANTQVARFNYPVPILAEIRGLELRDPQADGSHGVSLEFEGGRVSGDATGCRAVDGTGAEVRRFGEGPVRPLETWLEAIRSGRPGPGRDAETGHLSSALAHLADISLRTGPHLTREAARARIEDPALADAFDRMDAHLLAHGIDLGGEKIAVGDQLPVDPEQETITGPREADARMLVDGHYRKGFSLTP